MSMSRLFEEFGPPAAELGTAEISSEGLEEEKLKSFEAGYGAGWEDAVKAQTDAASQLATDLSQSISDMEFTFHEATGQFADLIQPILQQIVTKMLPNIARETLGVHIVDEIKALLDGMVSDHVIIATSPDHAEPLSKLLDSHPELNASVLADANLSPGQAQIRIADTERELDLDTVISGIDDAVAAFFHALKEGKQDG